MSGTMSPELARAASHIAFMAEVKASGMSPGRFIARRFREQIDKRPRHEGESLPGRTWRGMHESVRTIVVMLACEQQGDPARLARQPWESFAPADQSAMAATARMLSGELRHAGSLW